MSQTFTSVDDQALCATIAKARHRLVFAAPGIRPPVAKALADAMAVVPVDAIHIVLDVDAEVCRLGYGDTDFKGMELLQKAAARSNLTVNHHPGLRIGLLIADEATLIYTPTPQLIETESRQPEKPNAIVLQNQLPAQLADACGVGQDKAATLQIGQDPLKQDAIAAVKRDLEDRPPKEFNVARIERVFSSMLHYIELRIEDYKLTTRSLLLNPELFGVHKPEIVRRLTNRYHIFSDAGALTVEIPHIGDQGLPDIKKPKQKFGPRSIDRERARIKKLFVIDAGSYGSLILRRNVDAFEREISALKARIAEYKVAVKEHIKQRTEEIVNELLENLLEDLKQNPPEHWQSRVLTRKPTDDDVRRLFLDDVRSEVARVQEDFDPKVFTAYKDVTYQTFRDPKFMELMEQRFGKASIDRIFHEHDAAPETKRPTDH